jgi:hypothetical protein
VRSPGSPELWNGSSGSQSVEGSHSRSVHGPIKNTENMSYSRYRLAVFLLFMTFQNIHDISTYSAYIKYDLYNPKVEDHDDDDDDKSKGLRTE